MNKPEEKKITITKDGPYQVSGYIPLNQAIIVTDAEKASESWKTDRS